MLCFCSVNKAFLKTSLICNGLRVETETWPALDFTYDKVTQMSEPCLCHKDTQEIRIKAPAVLLEVAAVRQTAWPGA